MIKEISKSFEEELNKGLQMEKLIASGSSGLFTFTRDTYDRRTVYSMQELVKLNDEGFHVSNIEDMGLMALNILFRLSKED